jgi:hypothetical protein
VLGHLLRRLTATGLRRGSTGSRTWVIVGVLAGGVRLLQWVARDEPEVLYRTVIRPGDVFEIVSRRPPK